MAATERDAPRVPGRARGTGWARWALLLALGLASAAVAHAKGPIEKGPLAKPPERSAEAVQAGIARTRATFDTAFEDLRARLPAAAARQGHPLHGLHALLEFRRTRVGWLAMGPEDAEPSAGRPFRSWMTVVPLGHPYLRQMQSTLQMTAARDRFVVYIAEAEYHPTWSMLFAIHELTHLYDRDLGIEPLHPTRREFLDAEVRAYRNELQVAELLSGGTFLPALDATLDAWGPKSLEALEALANNLPDADAERLAKAIDHAEARSEEEEGLRLGFFWMALVIRHADRVGAGDAAVRAALARRMPGTNDDAKVGK